MLSLWSLLLRYEQEQAGVADPRCGDVVEEQLGGLVAGSYESGSTHPKRAGIDENGRIHVELDKGFGLFRVGHRTMTSGRWNPGLQVICICGS